MGTFFLFEIGMSEERKARLRAQGAIFISDLFSEERMLSMPVRIRMLETRKYMDGVTEVEFKKGEIYATPEAVSALFLGYGAAEVVEDRGKKK